MSSWLPRLWTLIHLHLSLHGAIPMARRPPNWSILSHPLTTQARCSRKSLIYIYAWMFFLKHPEILTFVGTIPLQPRTLDVGQVRNCQRTENILTNIHVTIIILDHYMICVCAQKWLVYIIIVYTYIYIIIICIIIIIMIIISIVVIKNSNNNNNTIYIYIYVARNSVGRIPRSARPGFLAFLCIPSREIYCYYREGIRKVYIYWHTMAYYI